MIIRPDSSGHWYDKCGRPQHTIPSKGGKPRQVTVRDARKLGLFPSVTNVLSVLSQPQLEAWKQNMLVNAAWEFILQGVDGIESVTEESFKASVISSAQEISTRAMADGLMMHDAIEAMCRLMNGDSGSVSPDSLSSVPQDSIASFQEFYKRHGMVMYDCEKSFCNPEVGYGGKIDWVGLASFPEGEPPSRCIVDWKTQRTKLGKSPTYYEKWPTQLAAYAYGIHEQDLTAVSVVISTTEPGKIWFKVWEDLPVWYSAFLDALHLWCSPLFKNYRPFSDEP